MGIPEFIARCTAYREATGVSETWLSKKLLNDTYWLGKLAAGTAGIGVARLERAIADLEALEAHQDVSRPSAPENGAAA